MAINNHDSENIGREKILIIDDNRGVASALEVLCDVHGLSAFSVDNPQAGLQQLAQDETYALVIQDMNFSPGSTSGKEGHELFYSIRQRYPDLPIVLITAWSQLEMAVELVKAGASDYISKPWDDNKLIATIRNLLELYELQQARLQDIQAQRLAQEKLLSMHNLCGIVYRSQAMQGLLEMALQVAKSTVPVLITGPNGVGKEKIAEIIQANSSVKHNAFIKVNAGALPKDLIEAELFGAEAGAYTGALNKRIGRFEAADGGTLFLDEIGNLALEGQIKLLRVLQSGEFERLGSPTTHHTQVRLISATNIDLPNAIETGNFREDLFYRLNVIELRIPPLAERTEDILPLARLFLGEQKQLSSDALRALEHYHWPGNVRELQNRMQRAALLTSAITVRAVDLDLPVPTSVPKRLLFEPSKAMLEQALKENHGIIAQAARQLGLSRQALYRRLNKHGITP
ncbi:MAG: sigma-54-dependent Fis family transcriptional regulator [Spongiibacteraceae bacterium]|nr:sigma-54-dependent Fis family transcriptional regulator [Spongiibacteraceae bacterium]